MRHTSYMSLTCAVTIYVAKLIYTYNVSMYVHLS